MALVTKYNTTATAVSKRAKIVAGVVWVVASTFVVAVFLFSFVGMFQSFGYLSVLNEYFGSSTSFEIIAGYEYSNLKHTIIFLAFCVAVFTGSRIGNILAREDSQLCPEAA
jgi:hypothetical protein